MYLKKNTGRNLFLLICICGFYLQFVAQVTPPPFYAQKDSYVTNTNINGTYGGSFNLFAGATSAGAYRTFIRFDLSSIPSNAIITSASLQLRVTGGSPRPMGLERLVADWQESSVTWDNKPGITGVSVFTTPGTGSEHGFSYHDYTVTGIKNIVQHWVNFASLNHGISIRAEIESTVGNIRYASKETPTTTIITGGDTILVHHAPRLVLEYVLPIEIELVSTTHCSSTTSTDGSLTVSASEGNGTYTYHWYNSSAVLIGTGSPTISGLGYGWYGVKVTDGLGNVSYMSFLVGVECETVSIAYNPGPNYIEDSYITNHQTLSNDLSHLNFGSHPELWLRRFYYSSGYIGYFNWKGLLRFLILYDPNVQFELVDLKIEVKTNLGTTNNPVLRLVTGNWQEHVVTFNNQPSHSSLIEKQTGIQSSGAKNIDVKDFFDYWRTNPSFGFFLDLDNPNLNMNRYSYFNSADNSSKRPTLTFTITIPCPSSYPELLPELHGGYYHFKGTELFLSYNKDYLSGSGQLNYTVYNEGRIKQTSLPAASVEYGDNRIRIDMSTLSNGIYVLEVVNQKNRKYYFRFKKGN